MSHKGSGLKQFGLVTVLCDLWKLDGRGSKAL